MAWIDQVVVSTGMNGKLHPKPGRLKHDGIGPAFSQRIDLDQG